MPTSRHSIATGLKPDGWRLPTLAGTWLRHAFPDSLMPASKASVIFAPVLSLLLNCCTEVPSYSAQYYVFGTLVEVSLSGVDSATANAAFADLQRKLQAMHQDWHAWEPGKLTRINSALSSGQTTEVGPQIGELIRQSMKYEQLSGGRFNPAIGQLVDLWGFHTSDYPIYKPAPSASQVDAIVQQSPSVLDLELTQTGAETWLVRSSNSAVQLDFGGIAKGYAVDLAIESLMKLEAEGALVNAGGDLRANGKTAGRPWRIAIENPLGGIIGIIEAGDNEAIFTSGNYQRFGETAEGERYSHILDPRTGFPVKTVLSATVVCDSGIKADAAATALVVAGLEEYAEVAAAMGLDTFLLTDESGTIHVSPAMLNRLQRSPEDTRQLVVLN